MKNRFYIPQYYSSMLIIAICFMFCISTVGAAEIQSSSSQSLLQNPFSSSSIPVFIGETGSGVFQTSSQGEFSLTLRADRTRVYYQGKIQFDAILVRTATNEPVKGETITFKNLQDYGDSRSGVTNSYGRAVAGAYARAEPPQYENWIAETVINNVLYSSEPVSVQVLEFNAPIASNDALISINPFSGADIVWPWPYVVNSPFTTGQILTSSPAFIDWFWFDGPYMYYPPFTMQISEYRPYFPMFVAPPTSPHPYFPLFTAAPSSSHRFPMFAAPPTSSGEFPLFTS